MALWGLIPAGISAFAGLKQLFGKDPYGERKKKILDQLETQMTEGLSSAQERALAQSLWGAAMPGLTSGQRQIASMAASQGIGRSNIPAMETSNLWGKATSDISSKVSFADAQAMAEATQLYPQVLGDIEATDIQREQGGWGALGGAFDMAFDTLMEHFFPEEDLFAQLFGDQDTQEWYNPKEGYWEYGKKKPVWAE